MNIFKNYRAIVVSEIAALAEAGELPAGLDCKNLTVEPPRDVSHGDLATNAAMVLAKAAKMKPRDIAEKLADRLSRHGDLAGAEIAGPGFINITLDPDIWRRQIAEILRQQTAYGDSQAGAGEKVNVEYVSTNPTGPLHVGHVRGAVFGDALASLLTKVGFDVTTEYYINDAGAQVDILARSTHLRYREALGEKIAEIPDGMYPGAYLIPVGQALADRDGGKWQNQPEETWLQEFREFSVAALMDVIRGDLASLNIHQDVFFSELSLHGDGRIDEALADLEARDLVYTGVLEPPKGKTPDEWEPLPQTLFRATQFGDDTDRPVKKNDGVYTYFASDIAYHYDKYRRGFNRMIDIFGADHGGYVKRMKAAVAAVSRGQADLDIRLCQIVRILRDGEPVRMSKRAGNFILLSELVREVGCDVVRFIMLTRKNDAPLDFDFARVAEQTKDNPVFYVQYAHARVCSVLRNAARDIAGLDITRESLMTADVSRLTDVSEMALIRTMSQWPRMIETAALAHEPHRIAFFLQDLAAEFHGLWNKGNDEPNLRFIIESDSELTRARLAMIRAAGDVIASGLAVLGVDPVEEMR